MNKRYIFKVASWNIKSARDNRTHVARLEESIAVQISEDEYDLPSCFLVLSKPDHFNTITIKDIAFQANDCVQENEIIGYLKGYFGFTNEESITKSLVELNSILNNKQEPPLEPSTTWYVFVEQFAKWFEKKLKPCLEKEIELYQMYYSMDIVYGN
jgi:hypothetical protein